MHQCNIDINVNNHGLETTHPPAFNHRVGDDVEAEYDRLRDLARQEAAKRASCFERVRFRLPSAPTPML